MIGDKAPRTEPARKDWLSWASWGVAILMVGLMVFVLFRRFSSASSASLTTERPLTAGGGGAVAAGLPALNPAAPEKAVSRLVNLRTIIPTQSRQAAVVHKVELGDSIFGIAKEYDLKPETVLWANYDTLNDNPDLISIGTDLLIPPTDGVYYKWQENDTLDKVAEQFKVTPEAIVSWPANHLDMTNPVVQPGTYLMIPGGKREYVRQWLVGTIPRGPAGVSLNIPGACDSSGGTMVGSGAFIWPADTTLISGNDFWDGHLAIDIGAGEGMQIYASDSGVVVFAGGAAGGYGRMVMIDHGNGYQTLYAHLSVVSVTCGQNVVRGQVIGLAGSTGNSTGPHLHFEVRYLGTFINPHYVLP